MDPGESSTWLNNIWKYPRNVQKDMYLYIYAEINYIRASQLSELHSIRCDVELVSGLYPSKCYILTLSDNNTWLQVVHDLPSTIIKFEPVSYK